MDAQELQKLKVLAEAATPQNIDQCESKHVGGYIECPTCSGDGSVELTADYCNYDSKAIGVQFYGIGPEHLAAEAYWRAATPAAVLELIALAERAVSPAESMQSIDTPEFTRLAFAWHDARNGSVDGADIKNQYDSLIAHIDAQIAKARDMGYVAGFDDAMEKQAAQPLQQEGGKRHAGDPAEPRDDSDRHDDEWSAHGIPEPLRKLGARLAELLDDDQFNNIEPMLLACATQKQEGRKDANSVDAEKYRFLRDNARHLESPLVPIVVMMNDAGDAVGDDIDAHGIRDGKYLDAAIDAAIRVLQSSDNLQQASSLRSYLDASQELDASTDNFYGQQASTAQEPAYKIADEPSAWLHTLPEGQFFNDDPADRKQVLFDADEADSEAKFHGGVVTPLFAAVWTQAGIDKARSEAKEIYANITQDSTAQVEPAMQEAQPYAGALATIAIENPTMLEFALQLIGAAPCKECGFVKTHCQCKKAARATDAGLVKSIHSAVLALKCDPAASREKRHAFLTGVHAAAAAVSRFATPAQATPEGGQDLPPLPARDGDWAGDDWYTADSMHDYARAALAAQNQPEVNNNDGSQPSVSDKKAAEPVAWRVTFNEFRHFSGAITAGRDYVELKKPKLDGRFFEGCDSLVVTPLYRAAPPQQVDESGLPG